MNSRTTDKTDYTVRVPSGTRPPLAMDPATISIIVLCTVASQQCTSVYDRRAAQTPTIYLGAPWSATLVNINLGWQANSIGFSNINGACLMLHTL